MNGIKKRSCKSCDPVKNSESPNVASSEVASGKETASVGPVSNTAASKSIRPGGRASGSISGSEIGNRKSNEPKRHVRAKLGSRPMPIAFVRFVVQTSGVRHNGDVASLGWMVFFPHRVRGRKKPPRKPQRGTKRDEPAWSFSLVSFFSCLFRNPSWLKFMMDPISCFSICCDNPKGPTPVNHDAHNSYHDLRERCRHTLDSAI